MARAKGDLQGLQARVSPLRQSIQSLTARMEQAGLSTRGLKNHEANLRGEMERTNAAIAKQKQYLQQLSTAQHKMRTAGAKGAAVTAAGVGGVYAASRAAHAAAPMMGQGKGAAMEAVRIGALGLGAEESGKAVEFAKNFRSYGTSQLDNLGLMRDAITVFNDRHHAEEAMPILAKMKFANEAVFGAEHGADNERKFMDMMKVIEMRGGANNKVDFERNANMVQQVITATGGRVGAEDWMQVIKRGKIAAKGLDEKEFFYRLEPLVQEMGGNAVGTGLTAAYQNLYQGRTTKRAAMNLDKLGLIGDYSKVKHDKVGQTSQLNPGALKGADIFRRSQFEWMETVLLPALEAKGITGEDKIIDSIGSIFSNTNAGALMATMYQQRAMINKGYKLNHGADNIEQLNTRATGTPQGAELELLARRNDLYARMSTTLLPAYVKLLEVVSSATDGIAKFAQAHPTLTKAVLYGAAGLGLFAAGVAALAIPIGLMIAKGALLRFVLTRVGLGFVSWGGAARGAGAAVSWLWAMVAKGGGLLMTAGRWLYSMGGTLLRLVPVVVRFLGPWGMLAAGVASAAAYIWANWDSLGPKFAGWWQTFKTGFMDGLNYVLDLPARFYQAGVQMMDGLVNGITGRLAAVRDAIASAADESIGWFKEKLGIHSPSRVFMELGGYVSEGAALGIEGGAGRARAAALGLAAATMVPLPGMASADGIGAGFGGAGGGQASQIVVNVYAQPGMDAAAIGRAVAAELDRREQRKATRGRSGYTDME